MKKFLSRFLPLLCLLLLSGYSQLVAFTHEDCDSSAALSGQVDITGANSKKALILTHKSPVSDRKFLKLDAAEAEEQQEGHSFVSVKKQVTGSNYVVSAFARTPGIISSCNKQLAVSAGRLCNRYIIFLVIRL